MGGSFNPAHEGHLHVSRLALKDLALDRLWWLVSPQNPLKPEAGMAPFERRLRAARKAARHPRILVSDIERRLGVTYTAETLSRIKRLYPRVRFVWLMGADNLEQISEWKDWERVFASVPIAVFDRPAYGERALGSAAARLFADKRIDASRAASLADRRPPAWIFFPGRLSAASATGIREGGAVPACEAAEGAE